MSSNIKYNSNSMADIPKGKTDWERLKALTDEEVEARALADPDAQPLSNEELEKMQAMPDVKELRHRMDMTQEEFSKAFQLSLGTVRDWEQHRKIPLGPSITYLRVISANPDAVMAALNTKKS